MGELVHLAEYRRARSVLLDRARHNRLPTIRFFDSHYYEQLWFPPTCGGSDALVSVVFDDSISLGEEVQYDTDRRTGSCEPYPLLSASDEILRFD